MSRIEWRNRAAKHGKLETRIVVTGDGEETISVGWKVESMRRIALPVLAAAALAAVAVAGCGSKTQENAGPGVIFNNVIAGDLGGQLKVIFPDYSREPAIEHGRQDSETFMIEVHPAWSPDGQKLAFTRTTAEEALALFVRSSLGHSEAEATEVGPAVGTPVWSPTSDMVAYLEMSGPPGEGEAAGGGEGTTEATKEPEAAKPAEGEKKAEGETKAEGESAPEGEKPVGLAVVGTDGKDPKVIVEGEAEPVAWSDEGIFYTSGIYGMRDLRVVNPDTKKSKVVYAGTNDRFVGRAALSSDGQHMAIEVVSPDQSSVLLIKNLRTGNISQLTRSGKASTPQWAPNGRTVTFVSSPGPQQPGKVMTYKVGTSKPVALTPQAAKYRSPSFAADSVTVVYVMNGDVYTQKMGTTKAVRVTKGGDAAEIAWSPK